MLLAIDTSSRYGGAALADENGQVVEARLWRSIANHTAQLMPAVAELLRAQSIRAADLIGVATALGPGPFSALRVGVSAAKGLAMAGGFPIVGVDTLALEAGPHRTTDGIVAAWLDAGRNEVAAGRLDAEGNRITEDVIAPPEELLQQDAADFPSVIYCGEAAHARATAIREARADNAAVAAWTPAARLWELAGEGARRVNLGQADDLTALQPYYLRMPTIGAPRQRDRVRQGLPSRHSGESRNPEIAT